MEVTSKSLPQRLVSLDAFRGAVMALMVLVNTPGDGHNTYAPLKHAQWDGWTITDCVFPSFVWIVGMAITLSLGKRMAAGADKMQLMLGVSKRAAVIYALGLFVYLFPQFDFAHMRVLGVLQRIAICYLIASAIYLTTRLRGQLLWIFGLLGSYWLIMKFAPVPEYGAGYLDVQRNFAHYIDRIVLGAHNYHSTKTWDPEGIVSTLPAIATALFGILAGEIVALREEVSKRANWLFFAGLLLIAAGLFCDQWLPINKKLWTSSFALFMAGLDFTVFSCFLLVADGWGYKRFFQPLVIMGMNAISVYMASELLDTVLSEMKIRQWFYADVFLKVASPVNASLMFAVSYVLLMFAIAYVMYRQRWFLRA